MDLTAATSLVTLLKIGLKSSAHVTWKCDGWPRKNNRTPLPYYLKLCVSFQSHRWIQTGVTVRKRPIRVKIGDLLSHLTLKFDRWPRKTIGHLFYATSSFLHYFIVICEFRLELQSGNAQFGSKLTFFLSCFTLKFDRWPWTRLIWGIW